MNDEGFFERLIGDGRALFKLFALALIACGAFALFQAATGHFLPHDTQYLGMSAEQLCALRGCRVVHFMMHDRVSFGGVLIAIGVIYLWLGEFPMRNGEKWAWWAFVASGGAGFLSFLAYLGYGYLDTWHGVATLAIGPLFIAALFRTRALRQRSVPRPPLDLKSRTGIGRALLIASTFGIVAAGFVIMTVGMTAVFVPQDLEFMGISRGELQSFNSRLIPLIAHDRAGFGGALLSCGVAMLIAVVYGKPSRSLWQALAIAGLFGFVTAIGIHPVIGYTNLFHLLPAIAGCVVYAIGLGMSVATDRAAVTAAPTLLRS